MGIQKKRLIELCHFRKILLDEDPEPFRSKFKELFCATMEKEMLCYDCAYCTVPIREMNALHHHNVSEEVMKTYADIMIAVIQEAEYKEKWRNRFPRQQSIVDRIYEEERQKAINEIQQKQKKKI